GARQATSRPIERRPMSRRAVAAEFVTQSLALRPRRPASTEEGMRIHLISPTHYNSDGSLHKTTRYWTSALTLPYLKAITPPEHAVSFVDELFHDVDLDTPCDVVGIT